MQSNIPKDVHHFDEFQIPVKRWTTVLVHCWMSKSYHDSSIAIVIPAEWLLVVLVE